MVGFYGDVEQYENLLYFLLLTDDQRENGRRSRALALPLPFHMFHLVTVRAFNNWIKELNMQIYTFCGAWPRV